MQHDYHDLIELFNQQFLIPFNTVLVAGDEEPIYLPADDSSPHNRVIFAHGFYSSALHEIAHWCVAGEERRKLVDFGYWYKPDGRTEHEQEEFERVEVRPQAFEWLLAEAAGHRFHFSADNLSSGLGASDSFKQAVWDTLMELLEKGLPARLGQLVEALQHHYNTPPLTLDRFSI